jgi:metal-sulfur cluster biosynthetic enzyme
MSSEVSAIAVEAALAHVVDPCSVATGVPINLADMGLIKDVTITGGRVEVTLRLTSPICWQAGSIVDTARRNVEAVPGVEEVTCTVDAASEWLPTMMAPSATAKLRRARPLPVRPQVRGAA